MSASASRARLRDMLGADIQAAIHSSVPRQFVEDFDQVTKHYGLSEAELIEAKQAARDDLEAAIVCYSEIAKEIA